MAAPDLDSVAEIAAGVRAGATRSVARAISWCEAREPRARELVAALYGATGKGATIGVTGAPGAGKSTLCAGLARHYRAQGETVGIVCIDPTSPFTGGALLGDRIRMQSLYTDPGVFIRSMATRGALGGLAPATLDAIDILDAAGFGVILVETVGVGQDEVEIVSAVATNVVVLAPGMGDDIQASKAGVMEIGDVFVVNKADREGADRTLSEIQTMLHLGSGTETWEPPVLKTIANRGEGIEAVAREISRHRTHLVESGEGSKRRRAQVERRVSGLLRDALLERVLSAGPGSGELAGLLGEVEARRLDPYEAARQVLSRVRL